MFLLKYVLFGIHIRKKSNFLMGEGKVDYAFVLSKTNISFLILLMEVNRLRK